MELLATHALMKRAPLQNPIYYYEYSIYSAHSKAQPPQQVRAHVYKLLSAAYHL